MRAQVLDDPALAKHAGRFVWLSINAEETRNAEFLELAEVAGYPTFLVLDSASGRVSLRWLGSLTVAQFERLLDDGERAVAASPAAGADRALLRADRLNGAGDAARAARAYAKALRAAPDGWAPRARALESLLLALQSAGRLERCAGLARDEAPSLERGPSFANVASAGLGCALSAPPQAAWRAAAIEALEPLVRESVALDSVLADDRSSYWGMLVDVRSDRGDEEGAKRLAGEWLEYLEAEAGRAPDAETRAAFDSHRVSAALALGDPARAVPALLASERDLPEDYNPPARLALLYRELGRHDEALEATGRALARAYGPRKLRIYDLRADVLDKMGEPEAARLTLEEALRFADTLPAAQRPARLVEALERKLASRERP